MGGASESMLRTGWGWEEDALDRKYKRLEKESADALKTRVDEQKSESYEYVGKWKILFGKHKNTIYEDVPTAYLKWCDENDIIKHEKVKGYIKERLSEK